MERNFLNALIFAIALIIYLFLIIYLSITPGKEPAAKKKARRGREPHCSLVPIQYWQQNPRE